MREQRNGSTEAVGRGSIRATVTNVNTGGRWIVVQTVTSRHGPFNDKADADRFADALVGKSLLDRATRHQGGSP